MKDFFSRLQDNTEERKAERWGGDQYSLIETVLIFSFFLRRCAAHKHTYFACICSHVSAFWSLQPSTCEPSESGSAGFFHISNLYREHIWLWQTTLKKRSKTKKAWDSKWNLSSLVSNRATTIFPTVCLDVFGILNWRLKRKAPVAIKMNAWCLDNVINACPCCNAWRAKQQNNAEQLHTASTWLANNHHPSSIQLLRQSKGLV